MSEFIINPKVVPNINQVTQEMKKLSERTSINVKVKLDGKTFENVNKTVSTHLDDIGRKVQMTTLRTSDGGKIVSRTVTNVSQDFKKMEQANEKANRELERTNSSAKVASKSLNEVGNSTKKVGQSFADVIGKVGKFYLATLPIQMVQRGITETIEVVKDFDSALTEFKKVSDLSGSSLDNYTKKLGEMGSEVARTTTQMIEASTEFKKGGFSDNESAELAQIASLYQNIADSELTAGESASFIISQMKAFNVEAKDAMSIIDQVNEVSNRYAVSSTDLSLALTKTSSAMSALGNTSQETIGLVTAGTEIMTHQSSKVARGLRTIGNNIANLAQKQDTLQITVKGMTKNISLLDEKTGDMKSTFEVMKDIYTSGWNEMSNAEQQALAISLAGKNQFEVFSSVLFNFENALNASETALNSSGSAMRENEAYMQSLSA